MNRALCWVWLLALVVGCCGACGATGGAGQSQGASRYVMTTPMEPLMACRDDRAPMKWAVIVGINDYKDEGISDLQGAVNDAWSFYHYLSSPHGGAVSPQRMRLLLNQEATREAVVGALGQFLAGACPQDQVIIYFAGHGFPAPTNPQEAFLALHDTKLDNLVGSAVSMNQLPEFLKWRANNAGQLLMLVDACHSGFIKFKDTRGATLDPRTRIELQEESFSKALEKHSDKGWGAISASATDQFAQEVRGCQINGHPYTGGLFTCHLLRALNGEADTNRDGRVTLDETYGYLESSVRRDSRGQQAPTRSGTLNGDMELGRPGTAGKVAIPVLPETVTNDQEHPLRPWIWAGAGVTAAALITGAVFNAQSLDLEDQANSNIGDERTSLLQQSEDKFALAQINYLVAGAVGALTLSALLYDLLKEPTDTEDVYQQPPWFEMGLAPSEEGVDGWVRMQWQW